MNPQPKTVVVSGSSGLIGSALVTRPRRRRPPRDSSGAHASAAPARSAGTRLLASSPPRIWKVSTRWSTSPARASATSAGRRHARPSSSRVARRATALLARTLAALDRPPSVLLSASAIGIYGPRGDEVLDETAPTGEGFLADLCRAWEAATEPASAAGITVAHLRSGTRAQPTGGALAKQLPLFKFGLGGRFGTGRQWQSWISIDDEVGAIEHLLTAGIVGPVNLTAPEPVTNAEFTDVLARVLHRPHLPLVPSIGPEGAVRKRTRRKPVAHRPARGPRHARRSPATYSPTRASKLPCADLLGR